MWTPMHYNLCENVFCSTVIFQIQQNFSPRKLNLCVGIVSFIRVIHLKAQTVPAFVNAQLFFLGQYFE